MDFRVENHGSLFLVRPLTDAAREWIDNHTGPEAQFMGEAVAVEPRYVEDFVRGMLDDGLEV